MRDGKALVGLALLLICTPATLFASDRDEAHVDVRTVTGDSVALYSGSHALLIGVSDYGGDWSDLNAIPGELDTLAAALRTQGFSIERLSDPDSVALKGGIETFLNRYGYDPGNRLLVFFSGHGYSDPHLRDGYLVPSDAPSPTERLVEFKRKALPMTQILAWSRQVDAKHVMFMFDSCFSGTVFKAKSLPPKPPYITEATTRPVRQFLTAGDAGEEVPARSTFTPVFTDAFSYQHVDRDKGLQYASADLNRDGYVTGSELGLYLKTEVPKHVRQSPQYGKIPDYELSRGDFVFVVEPRPIDLTPPPLVARPREVETPRVTDHAPTPVTVEAGLQLDRDERRWVQEALNGLGFEVGTADGIWGDRTRAGIRRWQGSIGRTESGYLDGPGYKALLAQWRELPAARHSAAIEPEMVSIRGGRFWMGSPEGEDGRDDDERRHEVRVGDFRLGRTEVTVGEFRAFAEATDYRTEAERDAGAGCWTWDGTWKEGPGRSWRDPGFEQGEDHPVVCVSWNDAQAYIEWLNDETKTEKRYRLPKEVEWEYACRGGSTGELYCGGDSVDAVAWYYNNSGGKTHPVGKKRANGYGLHDMSGNVWEWTCSEFDEGYNGGESKCISKNNANGRRLAIRGGSWSDLPRYVRSAYRGRNTPDDRINHLGFRLAQD